VYRIRSGLSDRGLVLRFPAGVRDLYVLYSVHIRPWSNPTSFAVYIEGYFVLEKTDWGVRITNYHLLLKTVMRLKMKKSYVPVSLNTITLLA
jgi:hypothetical protein